MALCQNDAHFKMRDYIMKQNLITTAILLGTSTFVYAENSTELAPS